MENDTETKNIETGSEEKGKPDLKEKGKDLVGKIWGTGFSFGKKVGGDLREVFLNKDNLEEAKKMAASGISGLKGVVGRVTSKGSPEAPKSDIQEQSGDPTPPAPEKKTILEKMSIFRHGPGSKPNKGWILWEILAGLGILGYMGYQVMGTSSSTKGLNNAATAAQEAEALQAEVHSIYPTGYYVPSGDISSEIVTQKSTPSNMTTGGCSTDLCGPYPGSYFTVMPGGTTVSITLQPVTVSQCAKIIEQQAGSGIWESINGLNVTTTLDPSTVTSACGAGSVTWVTQ